MARGLGTAVLSNTIKPNHKEKLEMHAMSSGFRRLITVLFSAREKKVVEKNSLKMDQSNHKEVFFVYPATASKHLPTDCGPLLCKCSLCEVLCCCDQEGNVVQTLLTFPCLFLCQHNVVASLTCFCFLFFFHRPSP